MNFSLLGSACETRHKHELQPPQDGRDASPASKKDDSLTVSGVLGYPGRGGVGGSLRGGELEGGVRLTGHDISEVVRQERTLSAF
jgi:hypothetical protein